MAVYRQWGADNEQAYQDFSAWLDGPMEQFLIDIATFRDGLTGYIECVAEWDKIQMTIKINSDKIWVKSIKTWLEQVRSQLPEDQRVVGLVSWDAWYAELDKWMSNQEKWATAAYNEMYVLSTTVENLLNSLLASLNTWLASMKTWRDNWPTIQ